MSLNRYHNSRSSDNVFKLLHEEKSYLDILKGNVKSLYHDEIEEDNSPHEGARQLLLQEQEDMEKEDPNQDAKPEEEGTPKQQQDAAEKAGAEVGEEDEEPTEEHISRQRSGSLTKRILEKLRG